MAHERQTKPACLPEQLLCSAVGVRPERASARASASPSGQWTPHSSDPSSRPAFASIARAVATWSSLPEWDAQASAISLSLSPRRSAAPLSTSGQSLQRLDRRARIDRPLGVAEGHDDAAIRIDDRARAAMGGFNPIAARGLDDHRVRHELLSRPEEKTLASKPHLLDSLEALLPRSKNQANRAMFMRETRVVPTSAEHSPHPQRRGGRLPSCSSRRQRFKVTQAMNAPVPSAPMAMRPNSGTSNGGRTILPP